MKQNCRCDQADLTPNQTISSQFDINFNSIAAKNTQL